MKRKICKIVSLIVLALLSHAAVAGAGDLFLETDGDIMYESDSGSRVVARYYSLSDDSLYFVKLTFPDGKEYTLPSVLSASGVRYSDDRELVWWTKRDKAFAYFRSEDGTWPEEYIEYNKVP